MLRSKKVAIGLPLLLNASPENNLTTLPCLDSIWLNVRAEYFPDRNDIDSYQVTWSKRRQKRTLASCNIRRRRIVVANELNDPRYLQMLPPLLYHEMCHAFLGMLPRVNGKKRSWHGKEFRLLESRHPGIKELDAWIKNGGWHTAVRRARTKAWWKSK